MLKNLQEFAYRYVCCVPFDRRTIENFSLIYPQFLRLSSFSLFFLMCVRMFICLCAPAFAMFPRDFSPICRPFESSCVVLPHVSFSDWCPIRRERTWPSSHTSWSSPSLHTVDIDLKVGRFLVSLIPEKSIQMIRTIHDMTRSKHVNCLIVAGSRTYSSLIRNSFQMKLITPCENTTIFSLLYSNLNEYTYIYKKKNCIIFVL